MALRIRSPILAQILHRYASTGSVPTTSNEKNAKAKRYDVRITTQQAVEITPRPMPGDLKDNELVFDQKTHTGQAWDQEDYRLIRFTDIPKQVNPNIAMHLIAKVPPSPVHGKIVSCDGGGGALGHPKVYINLDKPGNHACGYCGLRFFKDGQPHDGSEHINV